MSAVSEIKLEREILTKIEDLVNENKVVIFSKTTCPYCRMAKDVLYNNLDILIDGDATNDDVLVIELDKILDSQRQPIREILWFLTGKRTVPQIWINGHLIGGYTDLKQLISTRHGEDDQMI